jgi:hypothetical protein
MKRMVVLAVLGCALPAMAGQIANPASVNCVDKGGKLEMRKSANGEYGVCVLPGGLKCEEWALMRGECSSGGANVPADATPQQEYCLASGGEVAGKSCIYPSGTCDMDVNFNGGCPSSMRELPGAEGAFLNSYGGAWLASDYIASALKGGKLYFANAGEAAFQIRRDGSHIELAHMYNFHDGCSYDVAGVSKTADGYELQLNLHPGAGRCAPKAASYADGRLTLRVMTARNGRYDVIARGDSSGDWRLYTRVEQYGASDTYHLFADYASGYMLAGKYTDTKGNAVEFAQGGRGDYGGKDFGYGVDLDYVKGPQCNILRLSGDAPFKSPVSFEKNPDGSILLYRVDKTSKNASGMLCTSRLVDTLTPVK